MQTWKIKKKATRKSPQAWRLKVVAVFMILATIGSFTLDFPGYYNHASSFVKAKTNISLGQMEDVPFKLGLDLRGGTHLVYEADMNEIPDTDRSEALEGVRDVIERRVNAFGVSEPVVQTTSTNGTYRVIVELAGVLDVSEAISQIGETPVLEFKEPGKELNREPTEEEQNELKKLNSEERTFARSVLVRARANEDFDALVEEFSVEPGKSESKGIINNITDSGANSEYANIIKTKGVWPNQVYYDLLETGENLNIFKVLERKTTEEMLLSYSIQRIQMPFSNIYDVVPESSPWVNTGLSGKHLERAGVEFDQQSGVPYVGLTFDSEGGDLFGELTTAHIGEQIAIFLDGMPISTPTVQQAIYGGRAVITGDFTLDEAKLLSQRLNAGALPVPVDLLSQQTIGPTLGFVSMQKSIVAALIGFLFVALYMILLYRVPGLVSVIALFLFAFLNLLVYKWFGVTVTLAGIAGFVLSLGIAVDANVLIIERLKEELKSGRDFASATDEAFKRAWAAIRDGNITTLIAAGVLYWFSSSFIRGFAITLSIGVILSMFTAISVTRVYLKVVLNWKPIRKLSLFGVMKNN